MPQTVSVRFCYVSVNWQFRLSWFFYWAQLGCPTWLESSSPSASGICLVTNRSNRRDGLPVTHCSADSCGLIPMAKLQGSGFQASLCVAFDNLPFPKQITKDSSDSVGEPYQWARTEGKGKFVAIFVTNHVENPLKDKGMSWRAYKYLSWDRNT